MSKIFIVAILCLQGLFVGLSADKVDSSKEQLTARLQALTKALNEGNKEAIPSFWTDDAELVKPLIGEVIEGKANIAQFIEKRMKELKERQLKFSFKPGKVEFPEADKAVVNGVVEIGNDKGIFERDARRVELLRKNGQWYVDSVSDIEVPPAPLSHLKDMAWIVGDWKDTDDNVDITFSNKFDKFKNFIISRFTTAVYNQDAMEGIQVIGWDPIGKKIKSWVFDSDGGYGSGIWSKKGDNWEVTVDYTLSNGLKASATNIYTKVDNDHYRFASVDRKVNGEAVANVEPVTVTREEQ